MEVLSLAQFCQALKICLSPSNISIFKRIILTLEPSLIVLESTDRAEKTPQTYQHGLEEDFTKT